MIINLGAYKLHLLILMRYFSKSLQIAKKEFNFKEEAKDLTMEKALFWRAAVDFYVEEGDEMALEAFVPDAATLGPFILQW